MPEIDSNLLTYISESVKQGNTQESTRKTLLEAGWQLEDINQAFNSLTQPIINSTTNTVAEEGNYSSNIFSDEQPKAIRQEIIITRILTFIRFICLIIIFYFLWKISAGSADVPWQDIKFVYKVVIFSNISIFLTTFLFGVIVPIYNPMFAILAYSNFIEGRDLSIMEVASQCRKQLIEFIQFQVNFDVSFFAESLKALSDNTQNQKLYLNKGLIYDIALFSFLYGNQSSEEVKQKLAEIEKESPLLFQLQKLSTLMNIRTLYFIIVTFAIALFLLNSGVLDVFLFFPVLISIYVFMATGLSLKQFLNIQKKSVYFFYGIFKDRRYVAELKKQDRVKTVMPHIGRGFLALIGSLALVVVVNSMAQSNSVYGSLSLSLFIIGFGYLAHQLIIKQLYFDQAALSPTSSLGNAEENSMLESTKKYMGVTNNPQQAMRAYFTSLIIFFLIASIPGINFGGAVMLILTMVHQKIQILTKEEFEKNGAYKSLLTLAIITFIPLLGTIFGIAGIIYLLVLRKRYKKS